jgi:long-chain fatty acid transport protein
VPLPGLLSVGLNQRLNDRWTLLGEFEWQNWSRIGSPAVINSNTGATITTLPFAYSDGFFYSIGAEYKVNPLLALRAGIAYEKSPVTDQVRTPRIPDNDRMWYSVGASYKPAVIQGLTFDLGYSYIQAKNTPINVVAGNPSFGAAGAYIGSVNGSVNIISVSARYQWDDAAPAPMHQRFSK